MKFRPFWWWGEHTTMIEVASGWGLLIIGFQLAMPYNSFSSNPAFKGMALFIPSELAWAGLCLFAGLMTSVAVCGRVQTLRPLAARVCLGMWTFLAVSWFQGSPHGLAFLLYVVLATLSLWVVYRGPSNGHDDGSAN